LSFATRIVARVIIRPETEAASFLVESQYMASSILSSPGQWEPRRDVRNPVFSITRFWRPWFPSWGDTPAKEEETKDRPGRFRVLGEISRNPVLQPSAENPFTRSCEASTQAGVVSLSCVGQSSHGGLIRRNDVPRYWHPSKQIHQFVYSQSSVQPPLTITC
jgi:hypothetical protein